MPRLNRWMADAMERLFSNQFHPVEVVKIEQLDAKLKKVCFEGDLSGCRFEPGDVIEFRVSEQEFRHYTPARFDAAKGLCDVLFYTHGLGIGSAWVEQLGEGDRVKLMGPGSGKVAYKAKAASAGAPSSHLIFGDESSLGTAYSLYQAIHANGHRTHILMELDDGHHHWPALLGLEAELLGKAEDVADEAATSALGAIKELSASRCYLTGRARSIQRLKSRLKALQVPRQNILSMPYWADGKSGL